MENRADEDAEMAPVVGNAEARLRTVSDALEQTANADVAAAYTTVKAALFDFFSIEPTTAELSKLVYMLASKEPPSDSPPTCLTDREKRVATILAKFCADCGGAFELYHCKTRYHSVSGTARVAHWYARDLVAQNLVLLSPWTKYAPQEPPARIQVSGFIDDEEMPTSVTATVESEVAPWGLFEREGFAFDDETGISTRERWHAGTALVFLPIQLRAQLEFSGDEEVMLVNWLTLVDSHPDLAVMAMDAIADTPRIWSLGSPVGARALGGIKTLGSWQALASLLKSCEFVEFQPAMHEAVTGLTTDELVSVLHSVQNPKYGCTTYPSRKWLSSRLNMVASMLHGETDATRIEGVLDALPLRPSWWGEADRLFVATDQTPEEFARVLRVALRVSVDRALILATTDAGTNPRDTVTIARAVRVLVDWCGGPQRCGDDVMTAARHAHTQLASLLPTIRNAPYLAHYYIKCSDAECSTCTALEIFVWSTDQTVEFDKLTCEAHLLERLERLNMKDKLAAEVVDTATPPRIRLTKIFENDDSKQARHHAEALQAALESREAV